MPSANLPTFTQAEITASHSSKKSCYVLLGHKVFDVTTFLPDHPGGDDLVLEYAGKDVTVILADVLSHAHSESAYEILEDSLVGLLDAADRPAVPPSTKIDPSAVAAEDVAAAMVHFPPAKNTPNPITGMSSAEELSIETDLSTDYKTHKFIDLNKPMLMQVFNGGFSKDFYLKQVHRPRHYKGGESAPLFGNFLEPLSKTPWWVVPAIWLPCVVYGTMVGNAGLSSGKVTAASFVLGIGIWTLVEYVMHRFLFHLDEYVQLFLEKSYVPSIMNLTRSM